MCEAVIATFVKVLPTSRTGAIQKLWLLSAPVSVSSWLNNSDEPTEFVVTSAVIALHSGPETYIFPSDSSGEVTRFIEMDGSYRGGLNHEQAILGAGWVIA